MFWSLRCLTPWTTASRTLQMLSPKCRGLSSCVRVRACTVAGLTIRLRLRPSTCCSLRSQSPIRLLHHRNAADQGIRLVRSRPLAWQQSSLKQASIVGNVVMSVVVAGRPRCSCTPWTCTHSLDVGKSSVRILLLCRSPTFQDYVRERSGRETIATTTCLDNAVKPTVRRDCKPSKRRIASGA